MITNKIQAAHDAIDRLVTELERQATEHVHALDALRAENEALRTQNEHLRHLVDESRKVHEMNAREVDAKPVREVVRGTYANHWPAMHGPSAKRWDGRHAINFDGGDEWVCYSHDDNEVKKHLTELEAIAWVLDGVLPRR